MKTKISSKMQVVSCNTVVGVSGLVVGKSEGTGWPLNGSPFAEKNPFFVLGQSEKTRDSESSSDDGM